MQSRWSPVAASTRCECTGTMWVCCSRASVCGSCEPRLVTLRATGRSASWRSLRQKDPRERPAAQLFHQIEAGDRLLGFGKRNAGGPGSVGRRRKRKRRRVRPRADELVDLEHALEGHGDLGKLQRDNPRDRDVPGLPP